MDHLDAYEAEGIDTEFVDGAHMADQMGDRMAAERELHRRDVREGRLSGSRRLPGALAGVCPSDLDQKNLCSSSATHHVWPLTRHIIMQFTALLFR